MIKKVAAEVLKTKIIERISLLEGKRVLIIGDVGVDEYVLGQVRRISPEAPVPVLEVDEEDSRLGLSANVAQNVIGLGGIPFLVSVVGQDLGANTLKTLLRRNQVSVEHLIVDESRPTTRKTRVMAKHHHLVRVDYEVRQFISERIRFELIAEIDKLMPKMDIVILQDYAKGVVEGKLVEQVVKIAHHHKKMVLLDPHRNQPVSSYKGVDVFKPNFEEALALAGMTYEDFKMHKKSLSEVGEILRKEVGARWVVLTQGKEGMSIFDGKETHQVPTYARQVFDVTGAGDTVIATLAMALAAGFSMDEACVLANFAAGVVVGKVGCVPCPKQELIEYIEAHETLSH
jgi:rfaE bifunctional protein kinase chain/domain